MQKSRTPLHLGFALALFVHQDFRAPFPAACSRHPDVSSCHEVATPLFMSRSPATDA